MANRLIVLFSTAITFVTGIAVDFHVIIYSDMEDEGYSFRPEGLLENLVQVRMNFIEYSLVPIPEFFLDLPPFRLLYVLSHWIALGCILGFVVVKIRGKFDH